MNFWSKLKIIIEDKSLRNRILFVLLGLLVFRLLSTIPMPGIDSSKLANFFSGNQFLGLIDIFSGGGLSQLSIVMLGAGPSLHLSLCNFWRWWFQKWKKCITRKEKQEERNSTSILDFLQFHSLSFKVLHICLYFPTQV